MNNIEYRNFKLEVRGEGDSRHIEGYGSVFDSPSEDLGGFYEIIDSIDWRYKMNNLLNHGIIEVATIIPNEIKLAISGSAGMGIAEGANIPFVQEVYATRVAAEKLIPGTD